MAKKKDEEVKEEEAAEVAPAKVTPEEAKETKPAAVAKEPAPEDAPPDVEYITVKSGHDDNRTAFFEQHKHHPDGEAFVVGEKPVRVAKTSEVLRALNEKRIVEVGKAEGDQKVNK